MSKQKKEEIARVVEEDEMVNGSRQRSAMGSWQRRAIRSSSAERMPKLSQGDPGVGGSATSVSYSDSLGTTVEAVYSLNLMFAASRCVALLQGRDDNQARVHCMTITRATSESRLLETDVKL
ncbi:hypothetical protein ACP70R_042867 [Stipagrostis hirtigluma subsp. patula]